MSTNTMKKSTVATPASSTSTPSKVRMSRDPISVLREEMNDLISRVWSGGPLQVATSFTPALDVAETDNAYEVNMDIPGMKAEDFDIQVQGNVVTISGKREEEKEEKNKNFHCIERQRGSFSRTLTLPCDVNEDEVAAEYNNGILAVKLPKSEQSKTKKIQVKS